MRIWLNHAGAKVVVGAESRSGGASVVPRDGVRHCTDSARRYARKRMTLRAPVVALLAVLLASVVVGCGAESASPRRSGRTASAASSSSGANETRAAGDDLREALEDRADHEDTLRQAWATGDRLDLSRVLSKLDEVGAPPVDDDSDAAEVVERLADSLRARRDAAADWVGTIPGRATGGGDRWPEARRGAAPRRDGADADDGGDARHARRRARGRVRRRGLLPGARTRLGAGPGVALARDARRRTRGRPRDHGAGGDHPVNDRA